ncbi:MAG: universal stress protein [Myxococcota bacterium]
MDRLNTVLLATDFTDASKNALEHAAFIAMKNDATLHVLHVRVPFTDSISAKESELPGAQTIQQAIDRVSEDEMAALSPKFEVPLVRKVISDFDPADAICEYAKRNEADLIVVGTHGRRGFARLMIGSIAGRVIRKSPVSVLAVGNGESHQLVESSYRKILVPVDFSDASKRALKHALALGERYGSRVFLLHVVEGVPHPAYYYQDRDTVLEAFPKLIERTRSALDELVADSNLEVTAIVAEGRAHRKIDEIAREHDVDLVVMGRQGLGDVGDLLLGSVTERTLRRAPCPVLADLSAEAANI